MARLLIVEDDAPIRVALTRALTDRGHAVSSVGAGLPALAMIESDDPELVILDLGLPDIEGLRLLQMLRAVSHVPVIVATARDDDRQTVAALDAGADDYVVKPFSAVHLDARVRAVLRRSREEEPAAPLQVGGLSIDAASRTARLDGQELELSLKEFDMLAHLAEHSGQVISKRELLSQVWQRSGSGADKTVDVHLSWLRRKLGESGQQPRYLHTVRGAGVKLVDPDSTA